MLVEAIFFLVTVLVIVFIVLYALPRPTAGSTKLFPLGAATPVSALVNSDLAWSAKACSARFLLHIAQAPRTLQVVDCVQAPVAGTRVQRFEPRCPTFDFATCDCSGTSCTGCTEKTTKNSYLSKLVAIGDCVELWCAGYTSSNDKPFVPALLKIKTSTDSTVQWYYESISLPAIPLQRWTVVTLVKEGRRFDIFYGAKMVATKVLDHFPIAPAATSQWMVGAPGWSGQIGYFSVMTYAESSDDVAADVNSVVDTRGIPYDQITLSLNDLTLPTCVGGDCLKLPTVGAPNPFVMWSTTVA